MKLRALLAFLVLLVPGCAFLTPDIYVGQGTWQRGDGTTYHAAPPLQVRCIEVKKSRLRVRDGAYPSGPVFSGQPATSPMGGHGGAHVGTPVATKVLELEMTLAVFLEDGSCHEVFLTCSGIEGHTATARGQFTATNHRTYRVSTSANLQEYNIKAHVAVDALGPVHYRTMVDAY